MKRMIELTLICLPLGVCAQPGMSQADMQKMMEQAQQAQACMAQIDQSAMMAMADKAQAMEQEVKALCKAGKRAEAQERGMQFGLQIAGNETMQQARRCGEMMRGVMPTIGMPTVEEMKTRHICDGY